jgi:triphosphoribosyl-dephospho-CoA synthase
MAHAISANPNLWQSEELQSSRLAAIAKQALIAEAELTPKPGLVDRRGSGAHTDLALDRMRRSAETIEPFFARMADLSSGRCIDSSLREELAAIGREAEHAMFQATGGTNTHKGAIWVLGLLIAAAQKTQNRNSKRIAEVAGAIARIPDLARPELVSHGDLVRSRYGATGARGEAYANFPHVVEVGIPALRAARVAGKPVTASRLDALLNIMAELDDTCVLYRGGVEGANTVKVWARAILAVGGVGSRAGNEALRQFDRELLEKRISPGGSADLLAASLFLDCVESGQNTVRKDRSSEEGTYGGD